MNGTSATSNTTTPMTVKQTVREIDGDVGEGFLKRIIFSNTAYCWKKSENLCCNPKKCFILLIRFQT